VDVNQQQWTIGQNKPTPVANIGAAVLNGQVVVPGGYTAAGTPDQRRGSVPRDI
jgi:hypothetical protein